MAESGLSLGFADYQVAVARYLGWGSDSTEWSSDETDRIDEIIHAGLRKFYFPEPLVQGEDAHRWSFMRAEGTISITSGTSDYDAPDTFGGNIIGKITFDPDECYRHVKIVGEAEIRAMRQRDNVTGRPRYLAVRAKTGSHTGVTGTRFEFLVWPEPDSSYTLTYLYPVFLGKITAALPYPVGGAEHAETIKAAILSVAEAEEKQNLGGTMHQDYMRKLKGSIDRDRAKGPVYFGYNADDSDDVGHDRLSDPDFEVTYDGTLYP
jgi:hypothetical protein